jgi:RNA recognition motif-containing protein
MAKELYVGGLSVKVTEEDLRRLFSVAGTVTSVHMIVDPVTGEFKRCAYVRMAAGADLKDVVETLDGALLGERVITVAIARPQKPVSGGRTVTERRNPTAPRKPAEPDFPPGRPRRGRR